MSESATARARRDERTADDVGIDRALQCAANGCPNRWSVDAGKGRLCSAHAWSERELWPRITQEQLDAETDRALAAAVRDSQPPKPDAALRRRALSPLELDQLRQAHREGRSLGWATALKHREQSGERLTDMQRQASRDALRRPAGGDEGMQP